MSRERRIRSKSDPGFAWLGSGDEADFRRAIIRWFRKGQRKLPWRENRDPYRVWVSEIMLQQTQVVTVVEYFRRFVRRFPTIQKLASAELDDVLRLWEGLGYYRRARQLHAAARLIVEQFHGQIPESMDQLRLLPGVGRYTAGAILSIAYDRSFPILEGNTIRLLSRLVGWRRDVRDSDSQKRLWHLSESLLPARSGAGELNQALMELGSEICRVQNPLCPNCPVGKYCQARIDGIQNEIPVKGQKTKYQSRRDAVVVVERGGQFLLRKCQPNEHWQGLWDFPRFQVSPMPVSKTLRGGRNPLRAKTAEKMAEIYESSHVAEKFQLRFGTPIKLVSTGKSIRHAVTKYRITMICYRGQMGRIRLTPGLNLRWVSLEKLNSLALNSTGRKIVNWIRNGEL